MRLGDDNDDAHLGDIDFGLYAPENAIAGPPLNRNPELAAGRLTRERIVRSYFTH